VPATVKSEAKEEARKMHGSEDPPLQHEPGGRGRTKRSTGLKTRHYNGREGGRRTGLKTRHYNERSESDGDFQGGDQDVGAAARLIQSIVWEPE
jgi:hypothetical protein